VLLAASLSLGLPLGAAAQTTTTGNQQASTLQSALSHFDRETQTLATMRNHISSRDIVTATVTFVQLSPAAKRALARVMTGSRHAALEAALSHATVADVDRNNGQSEDQSSLAEYLQHLGVDPNNVIVVDVDPKLDPQNPRVTVFVRK